MAIRQLPEDVVDRLKSSVIITSLNGVVAGLLKNSLDAGATKINITIDYSRGNCTVEDNGSGIEPPEFEEKGGLCRPHHTSRFPPTDGTYGKHGDFLASLATFSLLSVSSRHRSHISHNQISLRNSEFLARQIPAAPEQHLKAFEHGTRVSVRDLFGSMPVRVKQRILTDIERSSEKEWQMMLADVTSILLAWHSAASVSLREPNSKREARIKPPDSADLVLRTSRIITQASLTDSPQPDGWVPISAATENASVKGCISTTPCATRRGQFISFGIHPLSNEFGTNVLYQEINKVFTNSSFGVLEDGKTGNGTPGQEKANAGRGTSGRKGVERWPMFYFRIRLQKATILDRLDDILYNRTNELEALLDLLRAVCYGFLKKLHLRPWKVRLSAAERTISAPDISGRSRRLIGKLSDTLGTDHSRRSSRSSSLSLASKPMSRSESPFNGWQQIKVSQARRPANSHEAYKTLVRDEPSKERLIGDKGQLLRVPFLDVDDMTSEKSSVSSRYFMSAPETSSETPAVMPTIESHSEDSTDSLLAEKDLAKRPKDEPSEWLKGVLKSWNNPVFENAPSPIPQVLDTSEKMYGTSRHFQNLNEHGLSFGSSTMSFSGRISKHALADAQVIAQIDRKFILVRLPLEGKRQPCADGSALVILDQHAIDERCQLEDLMSSYFYMSGSCVGCTPNMELLNRPLKYEVNGQEAKLFDKYQSHFAAWGIRYQPNNGNLHEAPCVNITALPLSIIERCRTEPPLLINLLRQEIWQFEDNGLTPVSPSVQRDVGTHPWVSCFHGCPRGILELLHSRSCRSAIMFNDDLSLAECENLVQKVAKCAFPFQCAHGRPSMAPVLDLGIGQGLKGWKSDEPVIDWRSWKSDDKLEEDK